MRKSRAAGFTAAAGMLLFGLATALLGAILPVLAARVHFNLRDAGTLFLVLNLGVFLCVFGLGWWIDRRGVKMPMVAGPLLVASRALVRHRRSRLPHAPAGRAHPRRWRWRDECHHQHLGRGPLPRAPREELRIESSWHLLRSRRAADSGRSRRPAEQVRVRAQC